jgi:hypothetical protein
MKYEIYFDGSFWGVGGEEIRTQLAKQGFRVATMPAKGKIRGGDDAAVSGNNVRW